MDTRTDEKRKDSWKITGEMRRSDKETETHIQMAKNKDKQEKLRDRCTHEEKETQIDREMKKWDEETQKDRDIVQMDKRR